MDVEPGPEFANFGLKLDDLGLQRHNELEQLGTFGAAGSGYRQGVTHASYYRTEPPKISKMTKTLVGLAFRKMGGYADTMSGRWGLSGYLPLNLMAFGRGTV
jgi:hypothetical protein